VGDVLGPYDALKSGFFQFLTSESEAAEVRSAAAQFGQDLGTIVVAAGLACRQEDARVGTRGNESSVDFYPGDCMALSAAKKVRALLEPANNGLGWMIVRLPFKIEKTWKKMVRLRVKVEFGSEIFRTSLFGDGTEGGHFILVNKKMQRAAGAKVGAMVDFQIEPDLDAREAAVTPQFEHLLKREKKLARWYGEQSGSMQREVGKWLSAVKGSEARQRRAEQMAERMLLTMEGERILPPMVELAFRRVPAASRGWDLLTATQRRRSLFAIFYYQSPEAREKRVRKLLED